jgi:hypothetical protein
MMNGAGISNLFQNSVCAMFFAIVEVHFISIVSINIDRSGIIPIIFCAQRYFFSK